VETKPRLGELLKAMEAYIEQTTRYSKQFLYKNVAARRIHIIITNAAQFYRGYIAWNADLTGFDLVFSPDPFSLRQ